MTTGTGHIRPYAETDEADVVALWNEAFPNDPPRNEPRLVIARKLAVQRDLFLVAEAGGRIVGAVLAGYDGSRGWVYHLAVAASQRRRGIARDLMAEVERRLAALGCPKINLQVRATNAAAVGFYRKIGYDIEDHISMGKLL